MLAIALVASMPLGQSAPQPACLTLRDPRFVGADETVTGLESVVNVSRGGHLAASFAFDLPEACANPRTGAFGIPDLGFLYQVTDSRGVPLSCRTGVDGAPVYWYDLEFPVDPPSLSSFDPLTGQGEASLRLPLGIHTGSTTRLNLALPRSTVRLCFGLRSELGLDPLGEPRGVLWQASVTFQTTVDDVTVEFAAHSALAGVSEVFGLIYLKDPPAIPTTIRLKPSVGRAGLVEPALHRFGPGDTVSTFHYRPIAAMVHTLRALDEATGTVVGLSASLFAGAETPGLMGGAAVAGSGLALVPLPSTSLGATPAPDQEFLDWLDYTLVEICRNAECAPPDPFQLKCGPCAKAPLSGSSYPDCPTGTVVWYLEPVCRAVFSKKRESCQWFTWNEVELTCDLYEYQGTIEQSCGSVGLSFGQLFQAFAGIDFARACCLYRKKQSGTGTIRVMDCATVTSGC